VECSRVRSHERELLDPPRDDSLVMTYDSNNMSAILSLKMFGVLEIVVF
jgi:hypothetical protein